jgi:flap endonuclease-1
MFYRTARMLDAGIKPVFVFEGKAPDLKREELAKRSARREGATADLEQAKDAGTVEDVEKYSKRTVRVTRQHNEECKKLLQLMGVPVVEAPGEAEAQCAQMCKDDVVWAISTEDMDSLTFGTPRLLRNLMAPASQKIPVTEFEYAKVLEELQLTPDQFIDLCILCGCDYTDKIGGIGPHRALNFIKEHGSIDKVLEALDQSKYKIPEPFPYEQARQLFKEPDVLRKDDLPQIKWTAPDEDGLVKWLVEEKNFDEKRVRATVAKINSAKSRGSQGRLETFFGPTTKKSSTLGKRKEEANEGKKGVAQKKGKLGGIGKGKKGKK